MKKLHFVYLLLAVCVVSCQSPSPKSAASDSGLYSESHLDFQSYGRTNDCCQASGQKIAIASGGTASSNAGLEIYRAGGNIVDAAVATAFCLAVEAPSSTGIGGGGFMTIHLAKKGNQPAQDFFVDFRETAPTKAHRDMYLDGKGEVIKGLSTYGGKSAGTPGFVAGFYDIHKRWGKLPWKKVLAPAIKLAKEGYPADYALVADIKDMQEVLAKDETLKKVFLPKGTAPNVGDLIVQADLAKTLEGVADRGKSYFYDGNFAKRFVAGVKELGGIISTSDLKKYKVDFRAPLVTQWNGMQVYTAPPPSAGGMVFIQMFQVLSQFDLAKMGQEPSEYIHLLAETLKRSYADRSKFIGDPKFARTGYEKLLTPEYAAQMRKSLDLANATPSSKIQPGGEVPKESINTTQLSLIDQEGNGVSSTITINGTWGAGVVAKGTGVILNNEMDDFSVKPGVPNLYGLTGSEANAIAANKRPVSSMTPTVLTKDGLAVMAVGGAGGSRIISGVLQVILNTYAHYPGDLKKAMFAPRVHHQWLPDKLELEPAFSPRVATNLQKKGYTMDVPPYAVRVQAVQKDHQGKITAVFDPRDAGGASAE